MKDTEFERFCEKISQLSDNRGYFERFYEILPETTSHRAAWEQLEAEREEVGLPERYSSYESFKAGKYHHHRLIFRVNSDGEE